MIQFICLIALFFESRLAFAYFQVHVNPSPSPFKGESQGEDFGNLDAVAIQDTPQDSLVDPTTGVQYPPPVRYGPQKIAPFFRDYARFRLSLNTLRIKDIQNKTFSGDQSLGEVNRKEISQDVVGVDFAYGFIWTHWRADIEMIWNRRLNYNTLPVIGAPSVSLLLKSHAMNYALLGNLYYDFNSIVVFKPYIFATLGGTVNKTRVDEISIATDEPGSILSRGTIIGKRSNTTMWPAWGFGFGARYRLTNRLLLDFFYRYLSLGSYKWTPTDRGNLYPVKLKGDFAFQGFGFGLHYLF